MVSVHVTRNADYVPIRGVASQKVRVFILHNNYICQMRDDTQIQHRIAKNLRCNTIRD